jgi:hypothetical protein
MRETDGNLHMHIDGSVTPRRFLYPFYAWQKGENIIVTDVSITMIDNGMRPDRFGGINGGLANGITITVEDENDNVILDVMDGTTVKNNMEWSHLAGAGIGIWDKGTGADGFLIDWRPDSTGLSLRLKPGHRLVFTINDDLSSIAHFAAMVQGHLMDEFRAMKD